MLGSSWRGLLSEQFHECHSLYLDAARQLSYMKRLGGCVQDEFKTIIQDEELKRKWWVKIAYGRWVVGGEK